MLKRKKKRGNFFISDNPSSFGFHSFLARYNLEEIVVCKDWFGLFGCARISRMD